MDKIEAKLREDINKYGWHVLHAPAEEGMPAFSYSIGIFHTFGHPEIVIIGLPWEAGPRLINAVGKKVRAGTRLEDGMVSPDFLQGYSCTFKAVPPHVYEDFFGRAIDFYGGEHFPVLQLVYPDREGRWPWEVGVDEGFRLRQPVLASLSESSEEGVSAEDLFVKVDPGAESLLLDDWRWKIGDDAKVFRATVFGDLFTQTSDGKIYWLNTGSGAYVEVAASHEDWESEMGVRGYQWFHWETFQALREMEAELAEGQVYSWRQSPMLGGSESVENIDLVPIEVHCSHAGRTARAIEEAG